MDSNVCKRTKSENILYKVKAFTLTDVFWYCSRYTQGKETIKPDFSAGTSLSHADKWTAQFYGKGDSYVLCIRPKIKYLFCYVLFCIKSESSAEAGYTKSTQIYNHPSVYVDMPEIVIENIEHSEESIMFFPDFITVQAVFKIESWINRTWCWECVYSLREQCANVFGVGMMKLRLEFLVEDLEFIFKILRVPMCFDFFFRQQNCT